jgi:hypothetical protein
MIRIRSRWLLFVIALTAMAMVACGGVAGATSSSNESVMREAEILEAEFQAARVDYRLGNAVDTTKLVPGDCFRFFSDPTVGTDVEEVQLLECANADSQYRVSKLVWQTDASYPGLDGFNRRATCGFGPRKFLSPSRVEWEQEIWRNIICLQELEGDSNFDGGSSS